VSRVSGWFGRLQATALRSSRHKLHAVRFGRLVASLRSLVDLGEDATDKLEGDWIFDRRYVASFVQRTLDHAREIVFDSGVLGEGAAELDGRLDGVRGSLDRLLIPGARHLSGEPSAPAEEPEYRLLREAIRRLALPSAPGEEGSGGPGAEAPRLAEVVRDAHERALGSFEALHFRSWGRRAGVALEGTGFPGSVRVVDTGGGTAPADRGWGSGLGWDQIRSEPFRALLESMASPPRERGATSARPSPAALAILSEERSTVGVEWPTGRVLIDANLEEHAADNFVYCALRGTPPGRAAPLRDALAESGFRRVDFGPGRTGWISGRDYDETRHVLVRLGHSLEGLLSEAASRKEPADRGNEAEAAGSFDRGEPGEWRA
jgi:hypothetical protein